MTVMLGLRRYVLVHAVPELDIWADLTDQRLLEIFYEARSQNPEQTVLRSLLEEGDTFIDCGANYGTFSLVAARMVGSSGKVIAIEPQPLLAAMIRQSAEANGFANVEVCEFAAAATGGSADLYVPMRDTGRGGLHRGFSGTPRHETLRVNVARLDDAIDWHRLPGNVVMKLDVEGAECDVIDGASQLIAERRPAMIVELNPLSAQAAGHTTETIVDSLTERGYDAFVPATTFAGMSSEPIAMGRQQNIVVTNGMTHVRPNRILTISCAE
jgi:FkbM family methyltransferase